MGPRANLSSSLSPTLPHSLCVDYVMLGRTMQIMNTVQAMQISNPNTRHFFSVMQLRLCTLLGTGNECHAVLANL